LCFSNSQEKSEFQELIAFHGTEMANIIDDLLVWARGDIGEVHVIPERVNLVESVRTTLKSMPQMEVPLRADDERLFALADPARVRQIVRNLATNAMRYGRDDVDVLVRREDRAAIVDVCDNGEEIPAQLRDQMFEPYARAHGRSSQPDSIGLGLTVARTLARLQDGDLVCVREGSRNVSRLTLPQQDAVDREAGAFAAVAGPRNA
jgi:two-component system OmpR family sensor kinase